MGKFMDWLSNRQTKTEQTEQPLRTHIEKTPAGEFQLVSSRYEYSPESYNQDSTQNIVLNGKYDLTHFSEHEDAVIKQVVNNSKAKYPSNLLSMGIANESYSIVYKPRYILFEMIIIAFGNSPHPLDQTAVGFAYIQKGASYRQDAIRYLESSLPHVAVKELNRFASLSAGSLFLAIAEAHEKEHNYEKAIEWYTQAQKASWVSKAYLAQKIEELHIKNQNWKPLRRKKVTEEQIEFEKNTHEAALRYLSLCGLGVN